MNEKTFYCDFPNFKILIRQLKEAESSNDTEKIQELKQRINTFLRQCGAPVSDSDLEKILNTNELEPYELSFLRNAPAIITRAIQDNDTKHAEKLCKAITDTINRNPKRYTIQDYETYEVLPDGTLKEIEPEPKPVIPNVICDAEIALRQIQRSETFPEICTKECPHTQCSSWGIPEMQGKPCRNKTLTNEQVAKNEPKLKARMFTPTQNTDSWINPEMKKSLRP